MTRPNSACDSIISRTGMFWKGEMGLTLGIIQTESENPRNLKRSNIRGTILSKRPCTSGKDIRLVFTQIRVYTFQVHILRINKVLDTGASLSGDEFKVIWLQRSRKRLEHRRIHQLSLRLIRQKKQQYFVYDLDLFVPVQLLKESLRGIFRWENCAKKTVIWTNCISCQPSYLIKNGRRIVCKTDNHIPFVVPGVQAIWSPDPSSGWWEADTSCGRPWATSGNRLTRMASTIHGRRTRRSST